MRRFLSGVVILLAGGCCFFPPAPPEYLVMTHDDFAASVTPLVQARRADGLQVKVIRTSQVGASPTADQIATVIRNQYQTGLASGTTLQYVLLVGDTSFVPIHYRDYPGEAGDEAHVATDLYYATMDGADYLPDIAVGRLPVNTVAEAQAVVAKIVGYAPASQNVLIFGNNPEVTAYAGRHHPILTAAGCVIDTAHDAVATAQTVNRINAGRALAAYYGHGSITGVSGGSLSSGNVHLLTNTELPVLLSGGCYNNHFDHAATTCLGELLVLKASGGAVAFVGSTRTGGYGYAYYFADGFYEEFGRSGRLGLMLNAGRESAYQAAQTAGQDVSVGSWTNRHIEKVNLLGDPYLRVNMGLGSP